MKDNKAVSIILCKCKRDEDVNFDTPSIFYINKSGCQWQMLSSDFAPWQTVYYYFRKWQLEGVWKELLMGLPMAIKVHEVNIHDCKGAIPTIENLSCKFPRLCKILADGGYQGNLSAKTE